MSSPHFEVGTWLSTAKYEWNSSRSGFEAFETEIHFSHPFASTPAVTVSLNQIDVDKDHNTRVYAVADKITHTGFLLQIKWWGDTHLFSAGATWFAIGTTKSDHHEKPEKKEKKRKKKIKKKKRIKRIKRIKKKKKKNHMKNHRALKRCYSPSKMAINILYPN